MRKITLKISDELADQLKRAAKIHNIGVQKLAGLMFEQGVELIIKEQNNVHTDDQSRSRVLPSTVG